MQKEQKQLLIEIENRTDNDERKVTFNNDPYSGFRIKENELIELLKSSRMGGWDADRQKGIELGSILFKLLNRNNGEIQQAIEESENTNAELTIYLKLPPDITEIPFELLHDDQFIAINNNVHFVRIVAEKKYEISVENRPLKMLFVVASPTDLKNATLKYEKEEELILDAVDKYPVVLMVEDTGSLSGIEQILFEISGADIIHISGHAGHDAELGPIFYMEDEQGALDKVTPDRLYNAIKDFKPSLLFLSGCSTGKSDKYLNVASFAYQMVELGIPLVLSWGLPVSDIGATKFTMVLYEKLAKGKSLQYAIQEARGMFKSDYHPWPLLRLFTDGCTCNGIVSSGQKKTGKSIRKAIHKKLLDSNVMVLDKGFVGRRRELQKALAVLRNLEPYEDKYGIIVRGPAGVGKSCISGRILERQTLYDEIIVFRGELERPIVLHELNQHFDKTGNKKALEIIGSDYDFEDKIKELYRSVFKEKNILIYFDNFEDNLELQGDLWYLKSDYINTFRPFLQFVDYAENQSKIAMTSRYAFNLQAGGENLSKKFLVDIPLMSLRDADENKKISELENIVRSKHSELYKKFGHGNPRLMEWLDKVAEEEDKYNLEELEAAIAGQEEEYIQQYLAEVMAKSESSVFWDFFKKASVYRIPVPKEAFEHFGQNNLLEKGVDLTLFEKEATQGRDKKYWVMPVIRKYLWLKLSEEEKQKMHREALNWYENSSQSASNILYHNEAIFHALEINEINLAAKHAIPVGDQLEQLLSYRDLTILFEKIDNKIIKDEIEYAKTNTEQSISTFFNKLGATYLNLGDAQKAIEYFEKALEIDLVVFGDKDHYVATRYNNLGVAYQDLGDVQKAMEYYKKALEIDLAVYGAKHLHLAIRYHNLGDAYNELRDAKRAVEYYGKALEINLAILGDKHQSTAADYNSLGYAYHNLGDLKKTVEYYGKALEIDLVVFGDKHPNVAIKYSNLGGAYNDLGDTKKALEYLEKGLKINLVVFGDKHPSVAINYNNLGGVYLDLGNAKKAAEYLGKALEIDLVVFGDKHPSVATLYNNLGRISQELGDPKKALEYYKKALEILLVVFDEGHPNIVITYKNLCEANMFLGDVNAAKEYFNKAREIEGN